jgi:acyl-CoA reductase-like NAD-dependent aldehyde dehydrogenase
MLESGLVEMFRCFRADFLAYYWSAVHLTVQYDEPALPFGGVKNSGWGRFNAEHKMDKYLVTKSVTFG